MTEQEHQKLFKELSDAKKRKVFVPFAILLRNGERYEVHNRWHFGFAEGNPTLVVLREDQTHAPFHWTDIAAIQILEPAGS